jgi:ribose transport system ATP-binding protein
MDTARPPLLAVHDLQKRYGAVVALRSGNLTVAPGEIHALLGANGAGKSTVVKLLTGVIEPSAGTIEIEGRTMRFGSPAAAQRAGLAAVFQDTALAPDLTVLENLRLTGTNVASVRQWLAEMDLAGIDFRALVSDLPLPTIRMLDLARALARGPRLLLLDEMTAALPLDLTQRVFRVMRQWRDSGRSVLFISHRLGEVRAVCDRATVLRDGRDVGVLDLSQGSEEQIVELMLGRAGEGPATGVNQERHQRAVASQEALLTVDGLALGSELHDVSFTLHKGGSLAWRRSRARGRKRSSTACQVDVRPAMARS